MSYRLRCLAQKDYADRTIVFQCAVLFTLLSCVLLLNACSGSSLPKANSIPSNGAGTPAPSGTSTPTGTSTSTGTSASPSTPAPPSSNTTPSSSNTAPPSPAPPSPAPPNGGNSFSQVQRGGGWSEYGQGPPNFVDCSPSPCNGISFWMGQEISSPSMSGHASEFNVGGKTPFSDALWNNHLIGTASSQGVPDTNQQLVSTLHNFTYDVYFFGYNLVLPQALEFDINQFFDNMGFIFGHECRLAGGNEWDVFDNQKGQWIATGIPCNPKSNQWNHLTIKVQRTSDNHLTYQSITLNGETHNLNWTFGRGSSPGWYGVTINYQMDGNQNQDQYNVYLDELTFSYN